MKIYRKKIVFIQLRTSNLLRITRFYTKCFHKTIIFICIIRNQIKL